MSLTRFLFDSDHDLDHALSPRMFWLPGMSLHHSSSKFYPRFDVIQKEGFITILAELPGCKKEDVKIDIVSDRLTISGDAKAEVEYEGRHQVTHGERTFDSFCRALSVPPGLKPEDIKASMEHGVLKVVIPAEGLEPVSIPVMSSGV